jgi:hypothetical protein
MQFCLVVLKGFPRLESFELLLSNPKKVTGDDGEANIHVNSNIEDNALDSWLLKVSERLIELLLLSLRARTFS